MTTRLILLLLVLLGPTQLLGFKSDFRSDVFSQISSEYNLPKYLLAAICQVESDWNPAAFAQDDGGLGNHSYGICQVSRHTAYYLGFRAWGSCFRRSILLSSNHVGTRCNLFDYHTNLTLAARYLRYQLDRYDNNLRQAISAYNAGSYYRSNSEYVRKVLANMRNLQLD